MKILLLTQWYPPEPMKLLSDMAETLHAMGHDVTVLTGFPNWPSGKLYPGYPMRLWTRELKAGVRIIRVPLFPDHSRSPLKRILNFASFAISAALLGFWLTPKPDVMHVVHPPITIGLPAVVLSSLWRIPFTLEIQDMWPENLRATGMLRQETALRAVGAFAKFVYRRASAIRVISPGFRQNLISKGVPDSKVTVISNWVDTSFYRPLPPNAAVAQRFGLSGRFTVLYAGTIGLAQGLDVALDAAERLRDIPDIQLVFAGDGVEYVRLSSQVASRELKNVRFLGRIPGEAMPELYASADVLFLHLRNDPLFHITIPHKIFTYMASGKMVLAAMKGDVEDLVREAHCGIVCPPDDPEALANAIRECYQLAPAQRDGMGLSGRTSVCQAYDLHSLVNRMAAMLSQAAGIPETGASRSE